MALNANLPLVGAQAVILNMAAFRTDSKSVETQLRQMSQAATSLERASTRSFSGVSAGFGGMTGAIVSGAAVALGALIALGAAAIKVGQQYDRGMAFVGAVSESTSAQLSALNDTQLELSRRSTESATNLSKASAEMVKAGIAIEEVTGASLQAVNDLIVASNGELKASRAALIAQVGIAAFGVTVKEAADTATAAVQTSTLTFTQYADAMRQGAAVAARAGITQQQFGAIVATAGQQLASGTEIGTGLRVMLQRLQNPSEEAITQMRRWGVSLYDAQGKVRPWFDVMRNLETVFSDDAVAAGKLTAAQRDHALAVIFDSRVVKLASVLLNEGTGKYLEMLDATQRLTANKLASQMLLPTAALLEQVGNNAQAAGIKFNQGLDPYINNVASSFLAFLQSIDINIFRNLGDVIGGTLYNAFANLGMVLGDDIMPNIARIGDALVRLTTPFGNLEQLLQGAQSTMQILGAAALLLAQILTKTVIVAVELAADVVELWARRSDEAIQETVGFVDSLLLTASTILGPYVESVIAGTQKVFEFLGVVLSSPEAFAIMRGALIVVGTAIILLGEIAQITIQGIQDYLARGVESFRVLGQGAQRLAEIMSANFNAIVQNTRANITSALDALGRLFRVFVPLSEAPGQMGVSWANAWSGIGGVVGQAVRWILGKANELLNGLASLPVIGEAIGSARAAVDGFLGAIPRFTANVGSSIAGFVNGAMGAFGALGNEINKVQLPAFQDFAKGVRDSFAKAAAERDALLRKLNRKPAIPDSDTEPGVIPGEGEGDAARAAKKAAEDLARAQERARELIRDFNETIKLDTEKVTNDIAKLYGKASDDIANSMLDAAKDINDAIDDTNEKLQNLFDERAIKEDAEQRREALDDRLEAEAEANDAILEAAEILNDALLEDEKRKFDTLQEIASRADDERLAAASRSRDITREDEDRAFEKSQDAQERALDKELDAEEEGLQDKLDLRENALSKQLDADEKALEGRLDLLEDALKREQEAEQDSLEKRQQQREDALQATLDAEARLREEAQDLGEIERKDTEARAKAEGEYTKELSIGVKQSIAQARLDEKLRKIQEDTAADRAAFEAKKAEGAADLEFEAQQEAKLQTLREEFERENLALETRHEDAVRALRESNENAMLALRETNERKTLELRESNEEEMTKLHEAHEKRRMELTDKLEGAALERRRDRAREDREFSEDQERQKRAFAAMQEFEALKESRRVQDAERVRRKDLEIAETAFKKSQEEEREKLRKTLEQEDYDRQVDKVQREHDIRINQINATLAEEQEKTRAKLAQDITDLNVNLGERINAIRKQYIDPLDAILKEGGDAMQPEVDRITGMIEDGLHSILDVANETVKALAGVFEATDKITAAQNALNDARARQPAAPSGGGSSGGGGGATLREGGKPGETDWEVKNFLDNQAKAANNAVNAAVMAGIPGAGAVAAIANALGFQYGGEVPGPFGQEKWVKAHGGERFEGLGGYGVAMTAVRMAEAMYARGTQGGPVTNNYSYQVDASYGRTQPEGSVRQDLSALVAMTRK